MKQKILIVSPKEPCGATWLINCFLELGVLTYRHSLDNMWCIEKGKYLLRSKENKLKKWLPSLHYHDDFEFLPNIELEWTHEWPVSRHLNRKVIYFYRDPRDALYSRYRRENTDMMFSDYLAFPEAKTLLSKVETNWLHTQFWLKNPNVRLFKFEDYKIDAEKTLRQILTYIDFKAGDIAIQAALDASTAEKAREVEERFTVENMTGQLMDESGQTVNQGGIVGRWQELKNENLADIKRVEDFSGAMLHELGYQVENRQGNCSVSPYARHLKVLNSFRKVMIFPGIVDTPSGLEEAVFESRIIEFSRLLTPEKLRSAGLTQRGEMELLVSLADYSSSRSSEAFSNIKLLASDLTTQSEFYFMLFKTSGRIRWFTKMRILIILKKSVEFLKMQSIKFSRYLKRFILGI